MDSETELHWPAQAVQLKCSMTSHELFEALLAELPRMTNAQLGELRRVAELQLENGGARAYLERLVAGGGPVPFSLGGRP